MSRPNLPLLHATVQFVLHREFVDEGQYIVNVGAESSSVHVRRIQNVHSMKAAHMGDLEFYGTVTSTHDYHGVFNMSEITLNLRYFDGSNFRNDVRKLCLRYLNKLVDVVRFHTKKYWLEAVTEPDIPYIRLVEYEIEEGKKKKGYLMGNINTFPIQQVEQKDVADKIQMCLGAASSPTSFEILILDSLNYFDKAEYNLAVIISHTALEIFLEAYVRDILSQKYLAKTLENKFKRTWEGEKLHKKIRRNIYGNRDENELLETEDSYQKFYRSRELKRLSTQRATTLTNDNALEAVQNIFEFIRYLNNKRERISLDILSRT
jgi:hypothetical protein